MSSTCYICLDEIKLKNKKETITSMGCLCKGSIGVHKKCFTLWLNTTRDPFNCAICQTGFSGKFMKNFFTEEEILFHGDNVDEIDEYGYVEIIIFVRSILSELRNECKSRKKFDSKTIKRFHKKQYQFRR